MSDEDDERLRAVVAAGVADGLAGLITSKELFLKVIAAFAEAAQETARREAGGWLIGWFKWVIGKAVLGFLVIFVLWWTGGLPAVVTYLKVKP